MIFSVLWLREWICLEKDISYIAEQLTMFGLHVDSIEPIPYYISSPIVGHIINYKRYSKNSYYIYSVDIGYKKLLDIKCSIYIEQPVCFNIAVDMVGSGTSSGSIISNSIGSIHIIYKPDILIKLPLDSMLGSELRAYFNHNDNAIKIDIAPNKTHCSSILGIIRVLSCLNNMSLKYPSINYVKTAFVNDIPTLIEPNRLCPCFVSRIIRKININIDTSLWIREKLSRCGILLTNVLNDITAYVLLELGQPIDIFDLNTIKEKLTIRLSKPNEVITLFNGNKIALNSNALVIADVYNILSLVGISKANYGSIAIKTTNIILSAIYINPSYIIGKPHYRLCSKLLYQMAYERDVDYSILNLAIERISDLIISICGGFASSINNHIATKNIIKNHRIDIHRYKLNNLIGFYMPEDKVNSILTNLTYKAIRVNTDWKALMPSWCFNIAIEEDLIEEVISIYGVCNINIKPIYTYLSFTESISPITPRKPLIRIKELLTDRGYHEVATYSFIEPNIQTKLYSNVKHIYIKTPIAKELNVVRSSLLVGLIKTLTYKLSQQQKRIRLFESGYCFIPDNAIGINQKLVVAGITTGSSFEEHWDSSYSLVDIYDIKGDLECIFAITNNSNEVELKPIYSLALHPNQSAAIFIKKSYIGLFGSIHPKLQMELAIVRTVFIFELYCESILAYNMNMYKASKRPYLPITHRQLSIIVSDHIMASSIISELTNITTSYIVNVNVSDVYYDNIKEGFKSLSLRFNIQSSEKPLKEYVINLAIKRYVVILKLMFNAYLRY